MRIRGCGSGRYIRTHTSKLKAEVGKASAAFLEALTLPEEKAADEREAAEASRDDAEQKAAREKQAAEQKTAKAAETQAAAAVFVMGAKCRTQLPKSAKQKEIYDNKLVEVVGSKKGGIECRLLEGPAKTQHRVYKMDQLVRLSTGGEPDNKKQRTARELFGMPEPAKDAKANADAAKDGKANGDAAGSEAPEKKLRTN